MESAAGRLARIQVTAEISAVMGSILRAGRYDEALEEAVALSPGSTAWLAQLGQAHAMAGPNDRAQEALRRLETLAQTRYGAIYGIKGSFLFATLRPLPRFQALPRRIISIPADPQARVS